VGKGPGKHKRPQLPPVRVPAPEAQGTRGVLELDRFTEIDLERWNRLSHELDRLHNLLYFGLAGQRGAMRKEILSALQEVDSRPFRFENWVRILPYRFALEPLSAAGSLTGVGARFNAGRDLPKDVMSPWPALYLAENFETAFREKYGRPRDEVSDGLASEELALQKPESIASVVVHGNVERVLDLSDDKALEPFCAVSRRCRMPGDVPHILHQLKIDRKRISLVRTPAQLRQVVMAPNWRQWPVQFEVPAHGQILASLLIEAGYEAVLYLSSKSDKRCLALFPCNLGSAATFVELTPGYPKQVKHSRLDLDTASMLDGSAAQ